MRAILFATVVSAGVMGLAGAAGAADLGPYRGGSLKDRAPPPATYARPFSWTGLYVGAQVGYGFGEANAQSGPVAGFNQTYKYDTDGVVGGGHIGYNWQIDNLVFGVEADLEGADIKGRGIGSLGLSHETNVDWLGSVRGRLGIAYDRTLFYATAGLAYGDVRIDKGFASYSDVRTGFTVGGGIEQAISDRLTFRLEYRYTDLGSTDFSSSAVNSIDRNEVDFHTVRAGVSFKF